MSIQKQACCVGLLIILTFLAACRGREGNSEGEGTPPAETATPDNERTASTNTGEAEAEEVEAEPTSRPTPTRRPTSQSSSGDDPQVRVIYSSIHVREEAGVDAAHMGYLYQDDVLQVLEVNDAGTWYEIQLEDGRTGWVATSVVEPVTADPLFASVVSPIEIVGQLEVIPASVNLRMGPGTDYWIMRRLYEGDMVSAIGRTADHAWYYVQSDGGYLGWLALSVVTFEDGLQPEDLPVVQIAPISAGP
jgi:uncharacterized protein YgiM (DUF1202 family)